MGHWACLWGGGAFLSILVELGMHAHYGWHHSHAWILDFINGKGAKQQPEFTHFLFWM